MNERTMGRTCRTWGSRTVESPSQPIGYVIGVPGELCTRSSTVNIISWDSIDEFIVGTVNDPKSCSVEQVE
jgi:hypothetical protein